MKEKQSTPLGAGIWFSAVFFGLVGQIAWVVENMYFAAFAQDIFANSGRPDMSYGVTTAMVILSAVAATVTTIFAGAWSDRAGKRKPFISCGYIVWGLTIMLFALLPMRAASSDIALIASLLVLFDCLMTFAGSVSNDAAFNAWVADVTDRTNRGRLNSILAILPVIAVVIVFVGLGSLYNSANESNAMFFIILGLIPLAAGILAQFVLKDSPSLRRAKGTDYLRDAFYGFRRDVFRKHRMIYICLSAACLIGIAQQTFFSYLINFMIVTLGLGDGFVIPMAVIIIGAAAFTGIAGILFDRWGRKHFYYPLLAIMIFGILSFWLIQFTSGFLKNVILYGGGVLMMGGILSLTGALTSSFQDHLPSGTEGRFQGVRMCFMVLIPMIIGPIISLMIGLDAMGLNGQGFVPPYTLFLAAAAAALPAVLPIWYIRNDSE